MERVGVIGVGEMGLALAKRYLNAGAPVAVHDTRPEPVATLAALGARAASSPREVAERSDMIVVAVGFDSEVEEVALGSAGVLSGPFDDKVLVISSTVLPDTVRRIGEAAAQRGGAILDAPMTRGKSAAAGADFLLLAGGDEAVFERCRPLLGVISDEVHDLGALGAGQLAKIVNNMLLWASVVGCFESLELAEAGGLDLRKLHAALTRSSANSWVLERWEALKNDALPWAQKDLNLAIQAAKQHGLDLPLSHLLKERLFAVRGPGKQ